MMKVRFSLLTMWLVLGLGSAVLGKEPEELSKLRQQYERKASVVAAELKRFYTAKLETLETQLTSAADYAQAKAVRAERDALHSVSQSGDSVIPLELEEAQITALKAEEDGTLTDWKSASVVEWSALRVPEGDYRVELELSAVQSASELPDGELMLEEVSELNDTEQNRVVFKLKDLLRSSSATPSKLSTDAVLELRRMPATLRLSVSKAIKTQEITLHAVDLILKAKPKVEADTKVSAELAALLKQQQAEQLQLQQKHSKLYQGELQQLASQAQPDLKDKIQEEMQRVDQLLVPVKQSKRRLEIDSGVLGLDQLTELEGARLVKDPANQGDLFKIEHAGKTQWVRLAWVVCPPLESTPSYAMKLTVGHFRISPTDAVSLGASAAEFTEFQLQDQPLTVLLRNREKGKDKDDSPLVALVFVPGAGLLQNLLIDVGLAVVDNAPGRLRSPLKQALEERELSTKNSPTPLGGWALSQTAK